jgi:autotransporter-associated beta strand protein
MTLGTLPIVPLALLLASPVLLAADLTIAGAPAINGMNTDDTVNSPDALILDVTGLGGNRSTDTMGAAIAKSGGNLTISGNGTLRVTGGSGDVLGIGDTPGRSINISLGSGGLVDIQSGAFVNGGWGGGVWTSNLADMNIASGSVFDVWDGSNNIRVDALTGAGSVQNGSNSPTLRSFTFGVDGGSGTFSGVIGGGTGRAGNNRISLTKEGTGTQILSGNNTYTGTTTIAQGTLVVDGNISTSSLTTVASGASLAGSGTVGSLTIASGGTLAPGVGPGGLDIAGDYTQQGSLALEIHGLAAGAQHDQLVVARSGGNATVSLAGSLGVSFGGTYTPAEGDLVFLVTNDGNDAVGGTFAGFPQDAVVTRSGGYDWQISYTANSAAGTFTGGNDIALRSIPESDGYDPSQYEPGLTFRLYDIRETMDQLYPLVPSQTPNVDEKRATIDWSGSADFAGYTQQFLVECFASLKIPAAGSYEFRMTSDDGSELWIGETLVIDHDGVHPATSMNGTLTLASGLHPLKLRFFQNTGGTVLKLEWRPPGAVDFATVPTTAFLTTAGVTRVVAPGKKEIITPGDSTRPGNGQPLVAVHPSWEVTPIHPASFQPKVGAMAVHPTDGRLFVATFDPNQFSTPDPLPGGDGKVWALTNTQGNDPQAVTVTEVASGLSEPLGMAFINGELHVSQRTAITRLHDANGDGYFETKTDIGGGWISDNYHHFHFGLLERDGFAYTTLSTAIDFAYPGLNGPNPPNRGTLVRTRLATGEVSYLAGGLRTPNGLCFGPEGEIFQTDNQGSWMPASRLNHLQAGRFYGHYNNTADGGSPSLFADQAATPPAVWFPQNEVANSPSQSLSIPNGPFAGDLLVGDITLGGINRVSLEKVHGVWQGCIYRFTQGLEGGVNRLAWGPNGSLYVGCIGGTGNWSWNGTTTGLQRLSPKPGNPVTFEIAKVSATSNGFEITYTKPIPANILENPSNYTVRQWSYQATADYGGPKIGEETLTVGGATASADRTRVTLVIPGLKKGHVVHLKSDPLADDGSLIHSTEAWYTLNEIPGGPFDLLLDDASVPENQNVGTLVGGLAVSHENSGEAITYSLPSGLADNARFAIDHANLTTATPFDYERRTSYQVRIRATDTTGLFTEADFIITVGDVTEESAPRRILLTNSVLPPDHQAGALVGRLKIDDADLGDLAEIPTQGSGSAALVEESFDYTATTGLSGQGSGSGFAGAWQALLGNATVGVGSLAYTDVSGRILESSGHHGLAAADSRLHRPLAAARGTDGTTTYASFIANPGNNAHFWGIEFWNGAAGDSNRVLQIGNELGFGVRVRNGTNKFFAVNDSSPHFYVVKIEHLTGNDRVSVWIDPPLAAEPTEPALSFTPTECGGSIAFNRVGFSDFVAPSAPALDELRIGDDWTSVTPHQESFPIFELVPGEGDEDNASFVLMGDRLTAASSLSAGLHRLRVRATDSSGLSFAQPLLVWVGAGHLDSNNDGTDNATASRLGFDPLGSMSPGAYFGGSGTSPVFGPGTGPEDFLLSSSTLPGNLYRVESSPDLAQWTLNPQSVIAPTSFLEARTEWPIIRPDDPRHFWRIVGGWPSGQGTNPLANGLAGLTFVGGSAGWSYDAATDILRHETAAPSDWLHFAGEYGDFLLGLDFRLSEGGNSGIFVRAAATGYPWVTGSEIQLTHEPRLPIHSTGALYDRIPAEPAADNRHSIWHRLEVLMIGGRVRVTVDGVATIDEADLRLSHPHIPWSERGVIGLQNSHAAAPGSIEFRNIRLIDLDP